MMNHLFICFGSNSQALLFCGNSVFVSICPGNSKDDDHIDHQGDAIVLWVWTHSQILMFDLWLRQAMRNSLPQKYLILRHTDSQLCLFRGQSEAMPAYKRVWGNVTRSVQRSTRPRMLKVWSSSIVFYSLSHYFVCYSANKRPVFRSRDLSHYKGGGSGGAV